MKSYYLLICILFFLYSCKQTKDQTMDKSFPVRLMTLDPGHFHAGLVQKKMYETIDPKVYVYAPEGPDVDMHINRINSYNTRNEDPTSWIEEVYSGPDYFEKMLQDVPGNVVVLSGNNSKKTEYISKSITSGIHVLADKPMAIDPGDFIVLKQAFEMAEEKGLLLYDIMTERYEITTILQKELSSIKAVFGELQIGSLEIPAITKESVHHFFKYVSGEPLIRPAWFFDISQQGEGIVDVTTHLVDLVQWEAFPGRIIDYRQDIKILAAKRWFTSIDANQFLQVTGLNEYPDYLLKDTDEGILKVYSNGEINYTIKGHHAKVSVIWNYQAPEGGGDTHYSIMRGTKCNLIIRQGPEENFMPILYIELIDGDDSFQQKLNQAVNEVLNTRYPGIKLENLTPTTWKIHIPENYKIGHEAHFGQVVEKYLDYLINESMPEWEVPNMITKYYITTTALKMAMENQ